MATGPWRLSVLLSGVLVLTLHVHLLLGDAGTDVDTGPTLQESAFQGIESVRQVECIADRENTIFVNILGDNETVLIYARLTKDNAECKPGALLSKCDFGPGNKIRLQVLVTDVSKAGGLRCCLKYIGMEDIRITCSSINITIPEKTILTTPDGKRGGMVSTESSVANRKTGAASNVFDEGTSTIVIIVVCTLLVIFVALFIVLLCVLIRVRKRKKSAGPRDFELLSFRRSFGGECGGREGRSLKRHASCSPPSGLPPDVPAAVMVMPYQAPLPLSAGGIPYMDDRGHVSGSVGQYQEPWISNGLTTFRPNPRVTYLPGFEGTMARENMAALVEDGP